MIKTDIAILGAGLSGLSAGYFLKNEARHKDFLIFEKEPEVGGLCRSKEITGYIFDYDGHLLHFRNPKIFRFVKGLLGENLISHQRNSWVKLSGCEIPYPFQNFFLQSSPRIAKSCLTDFIQIKNNSKNFANFQEWSLSTFGRGICDYFMFPYNQKFWTIKPSELSCEWLDGFVPVPKIEEVLNIADNIDNTDIGYNSRFYYPERGGIQSLISALSKVNKKHLYLLHEVTKINLKEKEIEFQNNIKIKFEYLFSGIPLPEILNLIPSLPQAIKSAAEELKHNSIFVLNLGIDRPRISDKHWIYFPEEKFIFYRVGFPMNFSSKVTPAGKSSLYAEVSYSRIKVIDKQNIKQRIIRDLIKSGILNKKDKIETEDCIDIKYGYPIYDMRYKNATKIILNLLRQNNIFPIGRYGKWKYMSMEDVIIDAKQAVNYLVNTNHHEFLSNRHELRCSKKDKN